MNIVGVIPAGGEGLRWGGYFKELLPIGSRRWLLNDAIDNMRFSGAGRIIIVTRSDKVATHAQHLQGQHADIVYAIQENDLDIYGAMKASAHVNGDYNLFQMPDTYVLKGIFNLMLEPHGTKGIYDFQVGVHRTRNPERFGVIHNGEVINKDIRLNDGSEYMAWGTLFWSRKVMDYWLELNVQTYTEAIQVALDKFEWRTTEMPFYFDMASYGDYIRFLEVNGDL